MYDHEFKPTHEHAEGGVYEMMGSCSYHAENGRWEEAVLYRDSAGKFFVRRVADFASRFKLLANLFKW